VLAAYREETAPLVLKLYNTRTRQKEEFTPLDPANVRMYVCGPTVYDYAHIGNARPVIVFDVLYRLLRHRYGADHVTYVRNITDVEDKINARAAEQYPDMPLNEAIRKLTEETAAQYREDVAALGCLPPDVEPRATDHIEEMKAIIEALVAKDCAYVAEGHVLFHVASMPDYGQLSRRSLDEMQAGARVEVAPYKRDPMDFVLWKPSKDGEPGWPSPCGINASGRPGWHIECSAMAEKHLGQVFDIHGGGIDLVFPHHENELAQSRCAHGTDIMANVWMHNGFLQVEGQKMSKSLGNFVTIHELLTGWRDFRWPGAVLKYAMLMTHYRQPIDWTLKKLEEAAIELFEFKQFSLPVAGARPSEKIIEALSDDLNTPRAISELRRLLKAAKQEPAVATDGETGAQAVLHASCEFLGLDLTQDFDTWKMAVNRRSVDESEVRALTEARLHARKEKNWAEADRIRDELVAMGIVLMDSKDPETGEIVTTWEMGR
jgi:cysteinyl-tRNA synthetase